MRSALRNPALTLLLTVATTAVAPQSAQASGSHRVGGPIAHQVRPVGLVADPVGVSVGLVRQAQHVADAAHDETRVAVQAAAATDAARRAHTAKVTAERQQMKEEEAERRRKAAVRASYPDTLDGWIREALAVMHERGIPGSYAGIHRNILRESGGDPGAVNDWDINAQRGTPSTGLLQVIRPTFEAYHVPGTAWSMTDPVANITAACNYAAARYGSIDHVDSAY